MRFDLHIHSCLSPCANLEMSPSEIVKRAVAAGMGGIALTDHQSARNTPAIAECARRAGLECLFGLEVCTAEEVHTLAVFDTTEQALAMTEWVYEALPKRVNDPDTFGDQPVVTWDDDIVEMEWRILAMACRRTIPETAAKCKELGGAYIAAHIDRPNFSVYSQLGCIPEGCFDAVELSRPEVTREQSPAVPRTSNGRMDEEKRYSGSRCQQTSSTELMLADSCLTTLQTHIFRKPPLIHLFTWCHLGT